VVAGNFLPSGSSGHLPGICLRIPCSYFFTFKGLCFATAAADGVHDFYSDHEFGAYGGAQDISFAGWDILA
jgi:hypothetical protein